MTGVTKSWRRCCEIEAESRSRGVQKQKKEIEEEMEEEMEEEDKVFASLDFDL